MGWLRQSRWRKLVALALILTMLGGCQVQPAQVGIPLAYGLTGLCLALLISPTLAAAGVGFVVGCVLGAAVYNNSLKLK
jgi:apolipoprotein N-acyltransferase